MMLSAGSRPPAAAARLPACQPSPTCSASPPCPCPGWCWTRRSWWPTRPAWPRSWPPPSGAATPGSSPARERGLGGSGGACRQGGQGGQDAGALAVGAAHPGGRLASQHGFDWSGWFASRLAGPSPTSWTRSRVGCGYRRCPGMQYATHLAGRSRSDALPYHMPAALCPRLPPPRRPAGVPGCRAVPPCPRVARPAAELLRGAQRGRPAQPARPAARRHAAPLQGGRG